MPIALTTEEAFDHAMAVTPRACSSPSGTPARGQADRRHLDVATVLPTPAQRSTAPARRRSSSGSRWCSRSLSRPSRAARTAQHRECSSGHGPRFLANLWQLALRAGVKVALCLVELRGLNPLTPCMPYTACLHGRRCSGALALLKARSRRPAWNRRCPLLSPTSSPRHAPTRAG